jgi:UDP-2-acetamido-3-amino-2,3-dideoxy-glucuronate N-acetyltransferase
MDYFVHSSSIVEKDVIIGQGTKILHFSHVDVGATIGTDCSFGQNVYIGKEVIIGNFVKVQNNVSIYQGVELQDYAFCGPSVVFTNDLSPRSQFHKGKSLFVKTIVEKNATIGANSTIVCGITIGQNSMIGAGSVVTKSVLPHELVYRNQASHKGWVCECGTRLESSLNCRHCSREYEMTENGLLRMSV